MSLQVMKHGSIILSPSDRLEKKIWATKHNKRQIIVKRSLGAMKVLYAIFLSGEGVAIKVLVEMGKRITGKYYKDEVLKKPKKVLSDSYGETECLYTYGARSVFFRENRVFIISWSNRMFIFLWSSRVYLLLGIKSIIRFLWRNRVFIYLWRTKCFF